MKLIVGLGNPGLIYKKTRHNIGFNVLDSFLNQKNVKFDKKKFNGVYAETSINNEKYIFLKPQKYMNLSGEVVAKFIQYFNISIEDTLIIVDDLDINCGDIKLKPKGSSGGHNGLKNIEQHIKTNEYKRIKVGIKSEFNNKSDFVLGKFTKEEKVKIEDAIDRTVNILHDYSILSFENLMNKYN